MNPGILCTQNIHYELLYNPDWGRDWFACTLESMAASKADYLMIMAYQERIRRELKLTTERELPAAMLKIFENGLADEKKKIIFKFEAPDHTDSAKKRQKLIATLQKTIHNARKNGWRDLVLSPCNNLKDAGCWEVD